MNCAQVQQNLSLYLYGELSFAVEDQLEDHLGTCSACQLAYRREKDWHAAVQGESLDVPLPLLAECRQSLKAGLTQVKTEAAGQHSWRERWLDWLPRPAGMWSAPLATASFLVLAGFAAGRWTDRFSPSLPGRTGLLSEMGVVGQQGQVRDIRPEPNGQVRIVIDQVHERVLVGRVQDDGIRQIVLTAAQDPDAGLRVDSIAVLNGQIGADVRNALIRTVYHDSNAAVRMKALEGLRSFADEPRTRDVLKFVLEHDADPDVRSVAIEVLASASDNGPLSPEVVGTLNEILQLDTGDPYVRMRCLQMLRAMDVKSGVY